LAPKNSSTHIRLGDVYRRLGQWDKAIAAFQEASRLVPMHASYQRRLAWLLVACPDPTCRDPRRAVTHAQRAVALQPSAADSWNALLRASLAAGDPAAAREASRKALDQRPDNLEQCFLHAAVLALGGDTEAHQRFCAHLLDRRDHLQ